MKYTNPQVDSSYTENDLGKTLYDLVLEKKPKKIVEIGVLEGYSSIVMAMAIDELKNGGHIYSYDLFEDYEFKHSTIDNVRLNLEKYGVGDFVTLKKMGFEDWLSNPEKFDFLHLDISNKGDTIEKLYEAVKDQIENGSTVVFEGGSKERDNVSWMIKYNQKSIGSAKVPFEVIDPRFPSLSMIKKTV